MGQMGEDQRATPDVAEPVKNSPSASSAPYDVAPPLPRESVAGKPWKEAGRSHMAAAARVEASSSTVARVLGMHRGSQARRLRERAKAARRTARALAPLTGQGSVCDTPYGHFAADHRGLGPFHGRPQSLLPRSSDCLARESFQFDMPLNGSADLEGLHPIA
jgi:hypothetical protein